MATYQIACPHCRGALQAVAAPRAGDAFTCPHCGRPFTVGNVRLRHQAPPAPKRKRKARRERFDLDLTPPVTGPSPMTLAVIGGALAFLFLGVFVYVLARPALTKAKEAVAAGKPAAPPRARGNGGQGEAAPEGAGAGGNGTAGLAPFHGDRDKLRFLEAAEAVTERYAMRLLQEMNLERRTTEDGWDVRIWRKPQRPDGTATHLILSLARARTADPAGEVELAITRAQVPSLQLHNLMTTSLWEPGRIGGLKFYRITFTGTLKDQDWPLMGVAFLGNDGPTLITLVALDRPENRLDYLKLAETAATTFGPKDRDD